MALADLAATMEADLEAGLAKLHLVADEHMPQIKAIAAIADQPLMQAAESVLHVDPSILEGFISGLHALARAFPKPEEAPAEPQPEPQAA